MPDEKTYIKRVAAALANQWGAHVAPPAPGTVPGEPEIPEPAPKPSSPGERPEKTEP